MEIPTSKNSFSVTPKIQISQMSQLEIFESMTLDEFYKLLEWLLAGNSLLATNYTSDGLGTIGKEFMDNSTVIEY